MKINEVDKVATLTPAECITAIAADKSLIQIPVSELGKVMAELIPMCYTGWTGSSIFKLTKGACCFILASYGSLYLISCVGSKGATVSKLGGEKNNEFREDPSGNVYVSSVGMYFIQRIGYNTPNIIAEEISNYPSDCTILVVK